MAAVILVIAVVVHTLESTSIDCGDRDAIDCMRADDVYERLDEYLHKLGFTRRRLSTELRCEGNMPVAYSDELLLHNGRPVALLSIARRYSADARKVEVDVDIKEVYNVTVAKLICEARPSFTACRHGATLAQFLP